MAEVHITSVDQTKKYKAMFVLKCKGKDLSKEIKELIEKYAKEFDEMKERGV